MIPLLHLLALSAPAGAAISTSIGPTSLLLTSSTPEGMPACLRENYHGEFAGEHVFLPPASCSEFAAFDSGNIAPIPLSHNSEDGDQLIWITLAGVDGAPTGREAIMGAWEAVGRAALNPVKRSVDGQVVFGIPQDEEHEVESASVSPLQLVHLSESGAFISVPNAYLPIVDMLLPPHAVAVGVPPSPLPLSQDGSEEVQNIPKHYARHLANITKHLRFNPRIATVVESLNATEMEKDIRWLTGEDSDIVSRHSFTEGARRAADWIKAKMEATGADCHLHPFLQGFAPNVICHYSPTTNSTSRVVLSGHYDSRGTFGSLRAPGGDDDGSGTAHVLAIARAIAENKVSFEHPVTLALFAGEEQGLWGSYYYARQLAVRNESVALHVQADMLAYHDKDEPLQLALPATIELPEAGHLLTSLSALYAPELVVGRTAACCSDHMSFMRFGFPATQVFEHNGPIIDPMYHQSGDVSARENYDVEQVRAIAKVTFAAVMAVAGGK